MKISTPEAYQNAINRINDLRSAGATAETNTELADLDSAVASYESLHDEPDVSKGKPTPNPYGKS